MGAIAASHAPGALDLFRNIMIASASLPGTFPPKFFIVVAGGKKFQEMHVDGGVETQVIPGASIHLNFLHEFDRIKAAGDLLF